MRILIDTHVFLWWDLNPDLLSPLAKSLCQDRSNTLVLSVVCVWEMQIKQQLGKLSLRLPISELIEAQSNANRLEVLPVNLQHVMALDTLPLHHKDPFDRILVAQSISEGISLLSGDSVLSAYPVKLLW